MSSAHYKPDEASKKQLTQITTKKDSTKTFTISPCAFDIVWGGDKRYWSIPTPPSVEKVVLLQVSWLEITGSVPLSELEVGKEYSVTFKLSMKADAFGWADSPVYFIAKPGSGNYVWRKADLSNFACDGPRKLRAETPFEVPEPALTFKVPQKFEVGDKLQFGMYEIWRGRWKGGLAIHQVVIEPFPKI